METYLNTLKHRAEALNVPLLTAFKQAGVPTSTYYRAVNGKTELRHDTAEKVMRSLDELNTVQQANHNPE